ncbi:class I SAM-dependent methyltransferase [Candidatus Planktophila versatilis]|nr:class I SAM-dependent methyltransferase [Candidatus Planktophila versatilis]
MSKSESNRGNVELYYKEYYSRMMGHDSDGILSILWKYPHKVMEKPFRSNAGSHILELGFGEGEHIGFVSQGYERYLATDIDADRLNRIKGFLPSSASVLACDALALPFEDAIFDRVIATCLIAHLSNPEQAMIEWRRVLKPGGKLTMYVPCEPGLSLRLFRKLFTAPKAKKLGFDGFNLYISRDHINDAFRVLNIAAEVFRADSFKQVFRPFFFRSWYLNLFCIVQISKAK